MYNLRFKSDISMNIFLAIQKYYKNYDGSKIKRHFGIEPKQFQSIYHQMDIGGPYRSFDEMYNDVGIKITKEKYKETILLLLSYSKNIIIF